MSSFWLAARLAALRSRPVWREARSGTKLSRRIIFKTKILKKQPFTLAPFKQLAKTELLELEFLLHDTPESDWTTAP